MEEIIALLSTNVDEALKILNSDQKDYSEITAIREEYYNLEREFRPMQVGNIQRDKVVGKGENRKVVRTVKIPLPFQKKIVNTSTAFEFGEPVTLLPNEKNTLSDEVLRLWRSNRIDSKLIEAKKLQKSELQCAILFYIEDLKPDNFINRFIGANENKDIRARILKNADGIMSPYFDASGDMKAFVWNFVVKNKNKEFKHAWIYTDEKVYQCSNESGKFIVDNSKPHGFGKIPVVYLSQNKPEWYDVEAVIDRLEVSVSKHANSNDYAGHPILKLYGEVKGAPDKDSDGKAFRLEQKETSDGKVISSDVEFLTYDNAPESVRLEQENLVNFIYSLTSTANLSFEALKGLGNGISGKVLKMLLIEPILKAKMNEGENRTIVQRIINVMTAGTINTTVTATKSFARNTYFEVMFNSIIPDDIDNIVDYVVKAKEAGIISEKTAIQLTGLVEDSEQEIVDINNEKPKQDVKTGI